MSQERSQRPLFGALIGRTFVHPVFDYLLIGGGLSLVLVIVVLLNPPGGRICQRRDLAILFSAEQQRSLCRIDCQVVHETWHFSNAPLRDDGLATGGSRANHAVYLFRG